MHHSLKTYYYWETEWDGELVDVEFEINFTYYPAEPEILYGPNPSPAFPPSVDVDSIDVCGVWAHDEHLEQRNDFPTHEYWVDKFQNEMVETGKIDSSLLEDSIDLIYEQYDEYGENPYDDEWIDMKKEERRSEEF